ENTITKLSSKGFKLGRSVNTGSTLFVSIGSTIGKVAQVRQRVVTNQQINAIESSEKYDANFVYSLMVYKAQSIRKLAATQAVPIINKTTFSQIEVYVSPNINEQQKIGEFFVELDNIIDLHQRKLQKLQNLKKAYLNEMFI
ncbi:MAG: restriction endonuclease subunit S, partial [Romboutsia sp.]|nr:restriction endonuclease subunit S [Romboutsia sp.]